MKREKEQFRGCWFSNIALLSQIAVEAVYLEGI